MFKFLMRNKLNTNWVNTKREQKVCYYVGLHLRIRGIYVRQHSESMLHLVTSTSPNLFRF